MAGVWQWTQPWVWTILVMPAPVPPIRCPSAFSLAFRLGQLALVGGHELDVVTGREPQVAVAEFVGDGGRGHGTCSVLMSRVAGDAHGVQGGCAGFRDVFQNAGLQLLVVQPFPVVFLDVPRATSVSYFGGPISVMRSCMTSDIIVYLLN